MRIVCVIISVCTLVMYAMVGQALCHTPVRPLLFYFQGPPNLCMSSGLFYILLSFSVFD